MQRHEGEGPERDPKERERQRQWTMTRWLALVIAVLLGVLTPMLLKRFFWTRGLARRSRLCGYDPADGAVPSAYFRVFGDRVPTRPRALTPAKGKCMSLSNPVRTINVHPSASAAPRWGVLRLGCVSPTQLVEALDEAVAFEPWRSIQNTPSS